MSNIPAHLPPVADAMTAADLMAHEKAMNNALGHDFHAYIYVCSYAEQPALVLVTGSGSDVTKKFLRCLAPSWPEALNPAWSWIAATPEREAAAKAARLDALRAEIAALEGAETPARREVV